MRKRSGEAWTGACATLERTLTFRLRRQDVEAFDWRCLVLGLTFVWLVGVGRHWDDLNADLLQRSGVGSLAYALGMSCLLWLIVLPVANQPINYLQTLTFVAMTSAPGLVYALPVEWWTEPNTAAALSGWALAFVAAYRVTLLVLFYRRAAGLHPGGAVLLTLLPLVSIMVVLAALRVGTVVGRMMAGIRDGAPAAAEQIDVIILTIGFYSLLASPVIAGAYLVWLGIRHYRKPPRREEAA